MADELDVLFGDVTNGKKYFEELQQGINCDTTQITDSNNNDKGLLDTLKEKLCNSKEEFISTVNSDNALPDELASQESVPITEVTQGIHDADNTTNEELISTHNSERAIADKPLASQDEISVISTHNSSKFVDESFN